MHACLQVAHFYSTIEQQMIPSQRPMMLVQALAFEQIIKVSLLCYHFVWLLFKVFFFTFIFFSMSILNGKNPICTVIYKFTI